MTLKLYKEDLRSRFVSIIQVLYGLEKNMNPLLYNLAHVFSFFICFLLIITFLFTLFILLPKECKKKIFFCLQEKLPGFKEKYVKYSSKFSYKHWGMLIGVLIVNAFAVIVYDDFNLLLLLLSFIISIVQIVAVIKLFFETPTKNNVETPTRNSRNLLILFITGFFCIVLAFTHIYFYMIVNFKTGFDNFDYLGMNSNKIDDWLNCFFYTVSLISPYSFTELLPNTYWMKFLSLGQLVIFYVFIYRKLSDLFDKNKKD